MLAAIESMHRQIGSSAVRHRATTSTGRTARHELRTCRQLAASGGDAGRVEAQIGQQLAALGVFDEVVGNAEPADAAGVEAGIGGGFQHGRAEAGHQRGFFDRDDKAAFANGAQSIVSVSSGLTNRALMTPTSRPSSRSIRAASRHAGNSAPQHRIAPSSLHDKTSLLPNSTGVRSPSIVGTAAFGIANRARAVVPQREVEHLRQVVLVGRRHDDHVRKHAQVADVERAVMRRAVGPGQAGRGRA